MSHNDIRNELTAIMVALALLGGVAVGVAVGPMFASPAPGTVCWVPENLP